jgi:hypothetical protein
MAFEHDAFPSRTWASQAQKTGMWPKWRFRLVGSIRLRKAAGKTSANITE